jgi:hypothetical protein
LCDRAASIGVATAGDAEEAMWVGLGIVAECEPAGLGTAAVVDFCTVAAGAGTDAFGGATGFAAAPTWGDAVVVVLGALRLANKRADAGPGARVLGGCVGGAGSFAPGAADAAVGAWDAVCFEAPAAVALLAGSTLAVPFCGPRSAGKRTADSSATSSAASLATSTARSSSPASIK